jgi:uncharacterized repeat protein (TIGR03806 family)
MAEESIRCIIVKFSVTLVFPVSLLIAAMLYLTSCGSSDEAIDNTISFHSTLSEYGLYKPGMSDLIPEKGVEIYDIASALFTDYAEKQRLLKIPQGKRVTIDGSGLPIFPEGTIIAKTFYYSKSDRGMRQIIETRLLIFEQGKWNVATYQWNAAQNNANLLNDGAIIPVAFNDDSGRNHKLTYKIPSQKDCSSCHRSDDQLTPIGPKARNLNMTITEKGKRQNQLRHFMQKGIFNHSDITGIGSLPNYKDTTLDLTRRARAYLDMNCAHCHEPAGMASNTSLNLGFSASFQQTGIDYNKQNIVIRMNTMGEYHMPKIGTTILDDNGVKLVTEYIKSLSSNPDH